MRATQQMRRTNRLEVALQLSQKGPKLYSLMTPPLEVHVQSSSSSYDDPVSSGSKRQRYHTPIRTQCRSKQPTFNDSITEVMIEVSDSIKMQARETAGNDSTPVVDVLSKVRRDTLKIVEDMWRAGEVGDDVFVMTTRIFQDSIKAEMLLNLPHPRI
ncbi:hypothetical protein AMTR_s00080p00079830 [Amborella trichopoda]|uniref:Uncharacterized protein n=1 Tax=Amborella trichopoda TaxID=13333 RepID=W1P4U9_AMBTC|nr:hypothetical protein AMTR_s00080p00079830 [Amborella trichopoda]